MASKARDTAAGASSVQRSFRFTAETLRLLDERADELSQTRNGLAQRLLEEGLHTDRHPLIYYRSGGSGRRAPALAGTRLYVGQVIETVRANEGSPAAAADYLELSERQVQAAVDYYADFTAEVDAHLEREREFALRARERLQRAQRVLG